MPTVTSLKSQKKDGRVNVFIDDKFGFGIDLDNLVLEKIKIGSEYTDKELAEIIKKAEFKKTLDKLLAFATLRPRSEKEVINYFKRKKIHDSLWKSLTDKLRHFELLDDIKFARWWVDQRQSFKPKPKRILEMELKIKGIGESVIDEVLGETKVDETAMARQLLDKKSYKWDKFEPRIAKLKKSQYLSGKGFSWETVEKVLD